MEGDRCEDTKALSDEDSCTGQNTCAAGICGVIDQTSGERPELEWVSINSSVAQTFTTRTEGWLIEVRSNIVCHDALPHVELFDLGGDGLPGRPLPSNEGVARGVAPWGLQVKLLLGERVKVGDGFALVIEPPTGGECEIGLVERLPSDSGALLAGSADRSSWTDFQSGKLSRFEVVVSP